MVKRVTAASFALAATFLTVNLDNTTILQDAITGESVTQAKQNQESVDFVRLPFERQVMLINSPGGEVDSMDLIEAILNNSWPGLDTEVVGMAASAAAVLFTLGKTRVMGPEDVILFHRARIMFANTMLTAQDLEDLLFYKKLKREDATAEDQLAASLFLVKVPYEEVKKLIAGLKTTDQRLIKQVAKNLKMDTKYVEENLLKANKDTIIKGEEAVKMGIATDLKMPSLATRILRGLGVKL